MTFSAQNLSRLALSSIIAMVGFVALHRACDKFPDIVVWWMIYALGCGVALKPDDDFKPREIAILAILPALIPVLVVGFFILLEKPIRISVDNPWVVLLLPIVSWFAIFLFGFARTPLRWAAETIIQPGAEERLKRTITVMQLALSGISAVALGIAGLG